VHQGRAREERVSQLFSNLADRYSSSTVKCTDGKSYDVTADLLKIEPKTVTEHSRSVPTASLTSQCGNSRQTSSSHRSVSVESSTRCLNTRTGLESRTRPES
jgi:hypothetical protein